MNSDFFSIPIYYACLIKPSKIIVIILTNIMDWVMECIWYMQDFIGQCFGWITYIFIPSVLKFVFIILCYCQIFSGNKQKHIDFVCFIGIAKNCTLKDIVFNDTFLQFDIFHWFSSLSLNNYCTTWQNKKTIHETNSQPGQWLHESDGSINHPIQHDPVYSPDRAISE